MKKLSTTVTKKNGEVKEISVWLDERTVDLLLKEASEEIRHKYILEEYKANLIERKETRRNQSLNASMDNGFDVADGHADVHNIFLQNDNKENIKKAISMLEPEQQWLIKEVFFKGRKQVEMAEELGVGESAIRSRLKKIYEKMKKLLN